MSAENHDADPEDGWQPARLIPTSGIKGADEQERRATSALLAVMMAVPEFSRTLLKKLQAPAGTLRTYIEPSFPQETGKHSRPDGALVVRRGKKQWLGLVEVKTGTHALDRQQIEDYLDIARDNEFDCVLTISNQFKTASEPHPVSVDRRKIKRVDLHHWSWIEILSEAVVQREHRGVSDPDQAWILDELIAYLENPQSGAMQFQDMGSQWVSVRDSARDGTIRVNDPGVDDVVARWDEMIRYLCLLLGRDLGVEVTRVLARKERLDPSAHRAESGRLLAEEGILSGTMRVPNAAGDIAIMADLRSRRVTASANVSAPGDGRPLTRIRWLTRQLGEAPDQLRVDVAFSGVRSTTSSMLGDVRDDAKPLLCDDQSKTPRGFVVSISDDMGMKRGGEGSFVAEATRLLLDFYRTVVQEIKPWAAGAPRLKPGVKAGSKAGDSNDVTGSASEDTSSDDSIVAS